jgi:hypothetical protein
VVPVQEVACSTDEKNKELRLNDGSSADGYVDELPFAPFVDTLKSILRKKYIKNVCKWLKGKHSGGILAEEGNSNWESALTIMVFSAAQKIFESNKEEKEFCEKIPSVCAEVGRRLLREKVECTPQFVYWDNCTWDTAVVSRALLSIIHLYPEKFSDSEKREILTAVHKAIHWLFMRFEKWEEEVKYPFGPSDVAQILITTLYLKEKFSEEYAELLSKYDLRDKQTSIEEQIFMYLIKVRKTETRIEGDIEERLSSWGDFFQTAEALDSLVMYYISLDEINPNQKKLMNEIHDVSKEVFRFLENNQTETGMWGAHIDTIRSLYIYVKAPKFLDFLDSEPHLVFKALRWICDEKQFFSDGSFLHTMFLTIFL